MVNEADQDEPRAEPRESAAAESTTPESPPPDVTQPQPNSIDEPSDTEAATDLPPDDLAKLQAELEETRQRVLRLQAELENFRKRTQRSMEEERRFACLPLMRDLLTVLDNLQRAIGAADQNENASGLLEGVKMVAEQLCGVLKRHHCEPIEAEGQPFDPNMHEAIGQLPSDSQPPGTVTHVTSVGYRLHDRVVRPSQVMIVAPPSSEETAEQADESS